MTHSMPANTTQNQQQRNDHGPELTSPDTDSAPVLSYTRLEQPTLSTLMRAGPYLVAPFRATIPHLCPICGEPGNQIPIRLSMGLIELLSLPISGFSRAKGAEISCTLCAFHYRLRRTAMITFVCAGAIACLLSAIFTVGMILHSAFPSGFEEYYLRIALGVALFACWLCAFSCPIATRGPRIARSERDFVYIQGVHPNLLKLLPSLPASPSGKLNAK